MLVTWPLIRRLEECRTLNRCPILHAAAAASWPSVLLSFSLVASALPSSLSEILQVILDGLDRCYDSHLCGHESGTFAFCLKQGPNQLVNRWVIQSRAATTCRSRCVPGGLLPWRTKTAAKPNQSPSRT